jgi:hypothetical protein
MKVLSIVALALVGFGCAHPSKFANDPRAAIVGPHYLNYIEQHPRDRDTQFYYPVFGVRGFTNEVDYALPNSSSISEFKALVTERPEPTEAVKQITGKGWPELERIGILLFSRND